MALVSVELKPCPFCNGEAEIIEKVVICKTCAANIPQDPWETDMDKVVQDWNTRADAQVEVDLDGEGYGSICCGCQNRGYIDEPFWFKSICICVKAGVNPKVKNCPDCKGTGRHGKGWWIFPAPLCTCIWQGFD